MQKLESHSKRPLGLGVPGRRVAGAVRSPSNCLSQSQHLTAIVPKSNIGLTTTGHPILFFYIPQTSAPMLELVVRGEDQEPAIKQSYKPSGKAGLVGIPLTATSLEIGKEYRWFFSVVCNPKERAQDQVVEGAIKRIPLQPQLATKLQNATMQERLNLYANAGIWQDTLTTLAQLLSLNPNDGELKADWKALLASEDVGLTQQDSPELMKGKLLYSNESLEMLR